MFKFDYKKIISESDLFNPEKIDWIINIISNNLNTSFNKIDLIIRTTGEQLSKDEKKALSIRTNAKISKRYFDSLTEKGKKNALGSAFIIVQRTLHKKSIIEQHEQCRNSGLTFEVELCSPLDDRTCDAALKLNGTKFKFEDTPELPLDKCDADYCRCAFLYHAIELQKYFE